MKKIVLETRQYILDYPYLQSFQPELSMSEESAFVTIIYFFTSRARCILSDVDRNCLDCLWRDFVGDNTCRHYKCEWFYIEICRTVKLLSATEGPHVSSLIEKGNVGLHRRTFVVHLIGQNQRRRTKVVSRICIFSSCVRVRCCTCKCGTWRVWLMLC